MQERSGLKWKKMTQKNLVILCLFNVVASSFLVIFPKLFREELLGFSNLG